jgi:N-acetylmuramoyl-L-alanine amidase
VGFLLPIAILPLLTSLGGTSIVVAGQKVDVGRPVVLWNEAEGFNGYARSCVERAYVNKSVCCARSFRRYSQRRGLKARDRASLQRVVTQLVLHFDGCVNSRSCFYSMHDTPRPDGGCGLSAHFMIDADGTIYQTLDVLESAWHAEQSNSSSIGIEICNRGDASRNELDRLPSDYRGRPVKDVVINGRTFHAFDFRPEQYESVIALARTVVRLFPEVKPVIPERDGKPLLETLARPLAFHGIVGHLHVDKQRRKWDPGAFDWQRLLRALHGFSLPVTVGTTAELPESQLALQRLLRTLSRNSEEHTHGHFPMGPHRLWHSGAHLRGNPDEPVFAPVRGRLMAARVAETRTSGASSSSAFVLMRHDLATADGPITFYSLLHHLAVGAIDGTSSVPWIRELVAAGSAGSVAELRAGHIVLLDRPVEAGDVVGRVGSVSRGAETGDEVHFEIFAPRRLVGAVGRPFRYLEAAADGPFVRRRGIVETIDADRNADITADELRAFFRNPDQQLGRETLRRLAVRHVHEWSSANRFEEFSRARELGRLSPAERRTLYDAAIAPYVFLTEAVAAHTGLPDSGTVYSYQPLTFLVALAAGTANVEVHWPARAPLSDADLEDTGPLPGTPAGTGPGDLLSDWTRAPPREDEVSAAFGPAVHSETITRKRADIPLIVLPRAGD